MLTLQFFSISTVRKFRTAEFSSSSHSSKIFFKYLLTVDFALLFSKYF